MRPVIEGAGTACESLRSNSNRSQQSQVWDGISTIVDATRPEKFDRAAKLKDVKLNCLHLINTVLTRVFEDIDNLQLHSMGIIHSYTTLVDKCNRPIQLS